MIKKLLIYLPIIILVLTGLYFIITTAPYVRVWVDEFCSAVLLRDKGLVGAQVAWWNDWSGRYSFVAFLNVFEFIGSWTVRVMPFLTLMILIASLAPILGIILSSLFVFLALMNAPNIVQSFYWQMGSIYILGGVIFLNLFLAFLVRKPSKVKMYIPFLLIFVAGGFSEAFSLALVSLLVMAVVGVFVTDLRKNKRLLKLLVVGLIGAVTALAVMRLSPGNVAREMTVTRPESMLFVIKSTVLGTKWYLLRLLSLQPFIYSLIVLFSSVFLFSKKLTTNKRSSLLLMFVAGTGAIFATAAVIAAGFYAMSILPPDRVLFIVVYMNLLCFLVFSFALSSFLRKILPVKRQTLFHWGVVALNAVAVLMLVLSVVPHWTSIRKEIKTYAYEFDSIETTLIQSAGKELEMKNIYPVGGLDSFTDNKGWVGSCLREYYKIEKINIVQ